MRNLMRWLPPVATHEIYVIPSYAAHLGAQRLNAAAEVVGLEEARCIARKEGAYELSEVLVQQLGLAGLDLGPRGEIPALSPASWLRSSSLELHSISAWRERLEGEQIQLEGILIQGKARDAFLAFLRVNKKMEPSDPWELLELADHFLFADSLQLLVRRS